MTRLESPSFGATSTLNGRVVGPVVVTKRGGSTSGYSVRFRSLKRVVVPSYSLSSCMETEEHRYYIHTKSGRRKSPVCVQTRDGGSELKREGPPGRGTGTRSVRDLESLPTLMKVPGVSVMGLGSLVDGDPISGELSPSTSGP